MFRSRFPAALLIVGLLALGGLGKYLIDRLVPSPAPLAATASGTIPAGW